MDKLSRAWNGCWRMMWPEAVKVLQGAPKEQDEIISLCLPTKFWENDFQISMTLVSSMMFSTFMLLS